jgi:hypothetical protein
VGYLAAIGSFTADGGGHITAGTVDANGAALSSYQSASITTGSSSYTYGPDNRGCATITTPFYTFITRFAMQPNASGTAQGAIEEWDAGPTPYIASGRLFQQNFPATVPDGVWVYAESGVQDGGRITLAGTRTASGGFIMAGEYDFGGQTPTNYQGLVGTVSTPDPTTGRFIIATTEDGDTVQRVAYQVSGTQQIEITSYTGNLYILLGSAQLQSGALTLSGNLVYYASGNQAYVTFATINANASTSTYTGNNYEDAGGAYGANIPGTPTCSFTIDSYGRVATSGTNCGTYDYFGQAWAAPPIFYLTGPNTGILLGTDQPFSLGALVPQSATAITPGTYIFGTQEAVSQNVETLVGSGALASNGSFTATGDGTTISTPQQGDEAISATFTVNPDGTFTSSQDPGWPVQGVIISGSQFVQIGNVTSANPTFLIYNAIPTP